MKSGGRALVLLVEDNPADVNLVQEALAEAHVDCGLKVLGDGSTAVNFFSRVEEGEAPCPDLVMLDLHLPRLNGDEVLRRMRMSAKLRPVKVMVITSSNAEGDREGVMALGATDFFNEPSSLEQYLELGPRVRAMLG